MCACVCVIGSALTYDPSDSPEGDSGGVSSLETRHCQNVRRSIRAVKEREAKTEREREKTIDVRRWNWSRLLSHRLSVILVCRRPRNYRTENRLIGNG